MRQDVEETKAKAIKLAKQVNELSLQEDKVLNRYKQSSSVLQKLRFAVRKMEKMHTEDFSQLKDKLGLTVEDEITEEIVAGVAKECCKCDGVSLGCCDNGIDVCDCVNGTLTCK